MKSLYFILLVLSIFSCKEGSIHSENVSDVSDSIDNLIQNSKKEELPSLQRRENLQTAYELITSIHEDSLRKEYYLDLVYAFYLLPDSSNFKKVNKELMALAEKTNDSNVLAKCYWRLGNYYSDIKKSNDSAFYFYQEGQKIYRKIGSDFDGARLLLNMAIIQKNVKDYTGSEITTTEAIRIFKSLSKDKQLYSCYNNLGIIYNELGEYERSLYYHKKALSHLEEAQLGNLIPVSLNNLGVVYNNQEKYSEAVENYYQALSYDSIYDYDPSLYAMLLDNLAHAKFRSGDTTELPGLYYDALRIRDSLKIFPGITTSKLHLAEYFLNKRDTLKAAEYAHEVNKVAKETGNFKDLLSSLLFLSTTVGDSALAYSKEHIRITDSLQRQERATRNKFARIRFETDEYILETERLNQRVMRISLTTLGIFIIFSLLYVIKHQRSRNKLMSQRHSANEEIYGLILAQKKTFEEGREKEKQHISRELHDGILGKLFGVRISLDSLNEEDDAESKNKRFECVEEIQKISEEIRLVSHKLSKTSSIDVDFKTVLEELVQKQNQGKIHFELNVNSVIDWEKVENDIKINIFRMLQEGITNIHKHSAATAAIVSINKEVGRIIIRIADNGNGFNLKETKKGIGLKNMQTRAGSIKGRISFESSGEGTRVEIIVPV